MPAPFDRILVLDFETRWNSKDYTLSRMTTESYIRDPRFKAFGASYKWYGEGNDAIWLRPDALRRLCADIDWSRTALMCHNAQFDGAILAWHFGCVAAFYFDTLSMARAVRGLEVGNSAKKLAEAFGLPPKGQAVNSTDGLEELTFEVEQELADYCCHDSWLCEQFFDRLREHFSVGELELIDMTCKMFVNPKLVLDKEMLATAIEEDDRKRADLLARLQVDDKILASNALFAELLRAMGVEPPTKISPTTKKETWALSKKDAGFHALIGHEREDIALLCEARLKVKSTQERTRAQRFFDIGVRGTLPVPLSYYGAHTGRWTAAKGSFINLQNLKRGSFLRRAIMAPPGYVLVVADLSQIEPRVLAWLARYTAMLDIFRAGGDPYATFGAQMFGIAGLTKESHPDLRQSAKSALLGCFAADTQVLTARGWVPIIQVHSHDLLWDGEAWVRHQGVVPQGEKEVLTAHGLSATSDHEILTERGWVAWCEAQASPSLLESALALANLPVSNGGVKEKRITPSCDAVADGRALLTATTSSVALQPVATDVRNARQSKHGGNEKGTSLFARIARTVIGCWTALAPSSFVVPAQAAQPTQTTAGVASQYMRRGWQIAVRSFATYARWMGGTSPSYNLTASTISAGMNPATCGSSHAASIWRTSAASPCVKSSNCDNASRPLKKKTQTYDIAYAGPRNRYTVLTEHGPIIVHNCGYGLGWPSFAGQLMTGFLGAPPVRYGRDFLKQLGVTLNDIRAHMFNETWLARMDKVPHICTYDELFVHCVATARIIERYRAAARNVCNYWQDCEQVLRRMHRGDEGYSLRGGMTVEKNAIRLPNGMRLQYPGLRRGNDESALAENGWVYTSPRNPSKSIWGGALTENIVQALARIVMTDGMRRIARRYQILLTVHDEVVVLVPEAEAAEAVKWTVAQMVVPPAWAPDIPLAAAADSAVRYGDAK